MPKANVEERKQRLLGILTEHGCLTLRELKDISQCGVHSVRECLTQLRRDGLVRRFHIRVGQGRGTRYGGSTLFGQMAGKVFYYVDEKDIVDRLLKHITTDPSIGVRKAITQHLRTAGLSTRTIDEIHALRLPSIPIDIDVVPRKLIPPRQSKYFAIYAGLFKRLEKLGVDEALCLKFDSSRASYAVATFLRKKGLNASARGTRVFVWK